MMLNPVKISRCTGTLLLMMMAALLGCAQIERPGEETGPPAARSSVERGPVRLTVEVRPSRPQLSDELQLILTTEAAAGVRIESPPFSAVWGDFLIRDFREPLPTFDDQGAQILRQIYALEPTRAGTLAIAPIPVHFHDERPEGDGQRHTIESEALTVKVSTMLAEEAPSLTQLRPATGPRELPSSARMWIVWMAAGLVLMMAVVVATWTWRRRRAVSVQTSLTPWELAQRELDGLVARRLADSDVKTYYVQLTGIVRRFIERSTGIRAPEQTTEEFLREMADGEQFASEEQSRLRQFLEAADLVKFAGYEPHPRDVAESLERARRFVERESRPSQEMSA